MGSVRWLTLCLVWQAIYQAYGLKMQITNLSSSPKPPPTALDPTDVSISTITESLKSAQEMGVEKVNSPLDTVVDTEPSNVLQQTVVKKYLKNLIVKQLQRLNSISNQDSGTPTIEVMHGVEVMNNPDVINADSHSNTDVFKQANVPRTNNLSYLLKLAAIINQEKIKESKKDNEKELNADILNDVPSFINSDTHYYSAPKTTMQESFNNLYDTQLAAEPENPYDINNLIRSKNSVSNFQPQIHNENVVNTIDDRNSGVVNSFNNLNMNNLLRRAAIINKEKIKESKKDNEKGPNIDILNDVPSFINSDTHIYSAPKTNMQENFHNLYDIQLALETENPYIVNNLIGSKNSISHFEPQIHYENVENTIEYRNPGVVNSFNNLNMNNLLRFAAIANQEKIKDDEKGPHVNILNDVPFFVNSDNHVYSAPKSTMPGSVNYYAETENSCDVNNLIRSKNSISHFQPRIHYENVENTIDDSSPGVVNSFNNLYNLQYLPHTYVSNQNVDEQLPVNSNVNNPWAKDSILQYLNSMQSLKNYQSLITNKPLNEYNFNSDPRVQNSNVFNAPIPQIYKQNAGSIGVATKENILEDILSLENDSENVCGSQYFSTTNLEGHEQTMVYDSMANIKNSVDTRTPTNKNLNNLDNLLYLQNAKYRNMAVNNVPSYNNYYYNVADHVNPFESNSNLEVPLQPNINNIDISVPNINLAQGNPANNVSTVIPSNENTMLGRTLDSRLTNNYLNSNCQLPNIELQSPFLIEPINGETLSEPLYPNTELPYDPITLELIESIPTSITDKRSAPSNPKRFYDTRAFITPNYRPKNPFKSGIGLNSISSPNTYAGYTGTKLSLDRIPIKPELLASIKPLSASPYSPGFGVDSLLNMSPLSSLKNDKNIAPVTDVRDNFPNNNNALLNANNQLSLSVNTFNNAFQDQTPTLDPVITLPTPYHLDIISNAQERSHDFNLVNPFITNTRNLVRPKLTNSIADDLQKLLNNHQTIVNPPPRAEPGGILPLPFAPEVPSLTIDPRSYNPAGSFYPPIIPQFPTINNVPTLPIVNPFPQHGSKINIDISTFNLSPYHAIPPNVDPVFQYILDPTNELPCSVSFDETPNVQSFDQAFTQLPNANNFPITNLFAPEHNINPLYSYPPFTPSEVNSSPLHYISAAPEIIEVPYNLYNDAFNIINSHTSQNLVGNCPIHNGPSVSFTNFDILNPQTGFMNPVSNLPNVYPSSNIMIPQALPTISYTNVVANNPLASQVDKLFSPSGVVTSINDAASIVAKSAISSLIAKKLKSKAQNTPVPCPVPCHVPCPVSCTVPCPVPCPVPYPIQCQTECLPPGNPYLPSCYDAYAMTAFESPFLFEQFYSLPTPPTPKKLQTNPELYNGFDVPDILSHLNFNEIPDLVSDYPDFTDFIDFNFETEMKKSKPDTSSVTVNIVPVIDDFSFDIRSPSSNPLIGYNDYPNFSPSYLPKPNINADAYLTQQVIDVPALASMAKGKDCKEIGRLLELLVMSELLNNNEYDLDALEAILAMLCVS